MVLAQLMSMINGLDLQYLVHAQKHDTRYWLASPSEAHPHPIPTHLLSFLALNKVSNSQHQAAVIDDKMYIFGGNHNGRYLNDLQV